MYRLTDEKKKLLTKFGKIQICNNEKFSKHPGGFGISPYFQEQLLYLGQEGTYQEASQITKRLLGLRVSAVQIYRLVHYYGQAIEADLNEVFEPKAAENAITESVKLADSAVVYAMVDGAMILTDEGYKENKLGRIFDDKSIKVSAIEDRGDSIESSLYTSHLGSSDDFITKIKGHMDVHKSLGENLVFISDGASWLKQMVQKQYPKATMILDMYHVMHYVGTVAIAAFGTGNKATQWIESQKKLLLDSQHDAVLERIRKLKVDAQLRRLTYKYLESNRDRIDYKTYRERNLLIGSGAIESAHRTVVQKRCKRSGQRWSLSGAQRVLNLRTCYMSNRWQIIRKHIEPYEHYFVA